MDNNTQEPRSPDHSMLAMQDISNSAVKIWDQIKGILSRELSEQSYKTWFEPVKCLSLTESALTIGVPDSYYGQWLKNHYHDLLSSAIEEAVGSGRDINYQVQEIRANATQANAQISASKSSQLKLNQQDARNDSLNNKYTFDNFVVGPGNRFCHAAAMAICEAPAKQYNPLFIYGQVGLGKTHLMQSIAHEMRLKHPEAKILYISSEIFTNQLISAIQNRSTTQFRARYRTLDLLLIDDIHFIAEKEATQEEFFHTFNSLYDAHKQIVVSSDRPPKDIPGLEERLVSRFGWGLVADMQLPDFETRVAILKKKMEKEIVAVPDDVLFFIANKIRSNIRELEGALIRVVAYCSLTGQVIEPRVVQDILKDSLKEEEKKISIDMVQRTVAEYFHISIGDLRAKTRSRSIARPRQIAMYLIRTLTSHSLPEIGEYFGGRDHTTVLHAFNKMKDEMVEDPKTKQLIFELEDMLKKSK